MSAANTILAATTSIVVTFPAGGFNANEMDELVLCANTNNPGTGEAVTVYVLDTGGVQRALVNPFTGAAFQIGPGQGAIVLPGGYIYSFGKTATVAAVGVDVLVKPRIGPNL